MTKSSAALAMLLVACGSEAPRAETRGAPTDGTSSPDAPPSGIVSPTETPVGTVHLGAHARLADLPPEGTHVAWTELAPDGVQRLRVRNLSEASAESVTVRTWRGAFDDVHLAASGGYVAFKAGDELSDLYVAPTDRPDQAHVIGRALHGNVMFWPGHDLLLYVSATSGTRDLPYSSCEIHRYDPHTRQDAVLGRQPGCATYPAAFSGAFSADRSKFIFWALEGDGRLHLRSSDAFGRIVGPTGDMSVAAERYARDNCGGCARFSTDGYVNVATDMGIVNWIGWEGWPARLRPSAPDELAELSPGGTYGLLHREGAHEFTIVEPRAGERRVIRGDIADIAFAPGDRRAIVKAVVAEGAPEVLAFLDPATGATTIVGDAQASAHQVGFSPMGTLAWYQSYGETPRLQVFALDGAAAATLRSSVEARPGARVVLGLRPESLAFSSGMYGPLLAAMDPSSGATGPIAPELYTEYGRPNANGAYVSNAYPTPYGYRMLVADMYDLKEGIGTLHPTRHLYVVEQAPGPATRLLATAAPGATLSIAGASIRFAVFGSLPVAEYNQGQGTDLFAAPLTGQ